ncbi:MAG: 2OG-Fe(II) oxygenase family protein [Kofleriaceae bacterium]
MTRDLTLRGAAAAAPSPAASLRAPRPPLLLQTAALRDGRVHFDAPEGFAQALCDGCFYLEIPEALDLLPGKVLGREFYRDLEDGEPATAAYRGFRERGDVYFDREHFQTEHVLLDRPGRARHFPPELRAMCDALNDIARLVLRQVLDALGVPEAIWRQVTGGAIDDEGTHWFAASHYRPELDRMGCAPHKDTGFVTILYIEREGLEASVAQSWAPIDARPGAFVVNFGRSLELLMECSPRPVRAILHRVRKTVHTPGVEDRYSFAAFVNPPATGMLYRYDGAQAVAYQSVEEFLVEFNKVTWNDRHDEFGIK